MFSVAYCLRVLFFISLMHFTFIAYSAENQYTHNEKLLASKKPDLKKLTTDSKKYYSKAAKYFQERKRPLRHFLDLGMGIHPIKSLYPFQTGKYPVAVYLNYRRERWGTWRLPVIFSIQYEHGFFYEEGQHHRLTPLIGLRYPPSKDLRIFYAELLVGTSFLLADSLNPRLLPLDTRLLFTHIIGTKYKTYRLYLQWGLRTRWEKNFHFAPALQIGIDLHL